MASMVAVALAAEAAHKVAGNLSPHLTWELANPKWAATLNPLLANPLVNGQILPGILLATGTNVINHRLGRKLQGYFIILKSANVTTYDSQAMNQTPDVTLHLVSSGAVMVSLYVF